MNQDVDNQLGGYDAHRDGAHEGYSWVTESSRKVGGEAAAVLFTDTDQSPEAQTLRACSFLHSDGADLGMVSGGNGFADASSADDSWVIVNAFRPKEDAMKAMGHETAPDLTLKEALAIIEKQREALDKLARLGNEPEYGNSVGNMIARQALALTDGRG